MDPVVSVLIPSFRHAPFLEQCLRSVAAQEGVPFEILVRDDGSDDGSCQILERLKDELNLTVLPAFGRIGVAAGLGLLLKASSGRFVVDFASDDVMPPGRLVRQIDHLLGHPSHPACCGLARIIDASGVPGKVPKVYGRAAPSAGFEEVFLGRRELHGATGMTRREALDAVGGWPRDRAAEDLALWLALTRGGARIGVIPQILVHWRLHGSNTSQRIDPMYGSILQVVDDHADHPLHTKARNLWRMRWWSALADARPQEALRRIPELGSWNPAFASRLVKVPLRLLTGAR